MNKIPRNYFNERIVIPDTLSLINSKKNKLSKVAYELINSDVRPTHIQFLLFKDSLDIDILTRLTSRYTLPNCAFWNIFQMASWDFLNYPYLWNIINQKERNLIAQTWEMVKSSVKEGRVDGILLDYLLQKIKQYELHIRHFQFNY